MWTRRAKFLAFVLAVVPVAGFAGPPLSAIDWLSDSVVAPDGFAPATPGGSITQNALPEDVSVAPLGRRSIDAIGLLPPHVTGLPRTLWGSSASGDLARRFKAERVDLLPAIQDLLYKLLLAELDPPKDAGPAATLFLARIDTLLALGALEPAAEMLEQAGFDHPEVFRRYFDVTLLLGSEDKACATLRLNPALSPTISARIFCLARGGEWSAAAVTLRTGRALGVITPEEDDLLARFLDPGLFDGDPPLDPPAHPSPLVFRMMEAIGEALPTTQMPLAFANVDLGTNAGWKAQITSGERLARRGAIDPDRLLGLYIARAPAASGGVWDRVTAYQEFDRAIATGEPGAISHALPKVWDAARQTELEDSFARLFARQLIALDLRDDQADLAFHIGLLSESYEQAALTYPAANPGDEFLRGIAIGKVEPSLATTPIARAISDAFATNGVPVRLRSLTAEGRLGEAILRAMELFTNGARGDLDELTDALAFFRAVGLEDTARRAALQLMLLERRG